MYFKIYYKSHTGNVLNLVEEPYRMQTADLFDYSWEPYTESGYITAFEKAAAKKNAVLTIQADTPEEYGRAVNEFFETVELDVLNMTPGRLYIGEQYMSCYITASDKTEWEYGIPQMDVEISIVTDYPYWITEKAYAFHMSNAVSTNNKRYRYRYAYRYANGLTSTYVENRHFYDVNFLMRIYGPCVNPMVVIDGAPYLVYIILAQGEYLEIDSRAGTVTKTMVTGKKENCFHSRDKEGDVFRKITHGMKSLNWSGRFNFDLIFYEERGEPKWPYGR